MSTWLRHRAYPGEDPAVAAAALIETLLPVYARHAELVAHHG